MVFVSPLLTCGKAYPWICDKSTLIKRGWEKIHQPENWKIWEKMIVKALENMGKSPINGGF